MNLDNTDTQRIKKFYSEALTDYGPRDARSLHWLDEAHQLIRFNVLMGIGTFDRKRVLDVGCALGDLYKYFLKKKIEVDYTGIDLMPEFIEIAQKRYPEASFISGNISEYIFNKHVDYIFASGAFSFKVADYKVYYFATIKTLFEHANMGVAFNMLNKQEHIDDDIYAAYDSCEVADFCKTFCNRIEVITDYLPQDFTIYLYK